MICFVLIFIFSFFVISDKDDYEDNFNCHETMSAINKEEFDDFRCYNKYIATASSVDSLLT